MFGSILFLFCLLYRAFFLCCFSHSPPPLRFKLLESQAHNGTSTYQRPLQLIEPAPAPLMLGFYFIFQEEIQRGDLLSWVSSSHWFSHATRCLDCVLVLPCTSTIPAHLFFVLVDQMFLMGLYLFPVQPDPHINAKFSQLIL